MTTHQVFGRERELRVLAELIDCAPKRGGVLIVRGEAGIGKSTLLAAASQHARTRGMPVLAASGVESEAHLSFAGLHQLLRPLLGAVDALPSPQRNALQAAFGLTDVAAPDPFLIALATLELLSDDAAHAPLLLLVEDAQWLDRATCDVLAFVARRLAAEPLALLIAIRDGTTSALDGVALPELRLAGLDPGAAGALLAASMPGLTAASRQHLLNHAAGNPLALVELPRAWGGDKAHEGALLPLWLPLTTRLERAFAARVSELPVETRALLLVAAVDDGGDLAEILAAAGTLAAALTQAPPGQRMATPLEALEPAIAARLIEVDEQTLRFRHPLMRSAIYQAASAAQRRAAHAALAGVLANQPDRWIWHRAAATIGPDEVLATALEAAALRAQRRGGIIAAVNAMERAAKRGVEPTSKARRLLLGAELAGQLGRYDIVARLLHAAEHLELAPPEQLRFALVQALGEGEGLGDVERPRALVALAEQAEAVAETELALKFLAVAASLCYWTDPGWELRRLVIATAERLPVPPDNPFLLVILAYSDPIERGAVVIERLRRVREIVDDPGAGRLRYMAASVAGDFELAATIVPPVVAAFRAQGRLPLLARTLAMQAWAALRMMDLRQVAPLAEEAAQLANETGATMWVEVAQSAAALLAAFRGEVGKAETLIAAVEQVALPLKIHVHLANAQLVRGVSAIAVERYAEGYQHLRRVFDPADPAYDMVKRCQTIGYLADAAVHSGNRDEARALMREVAELAVQTPSPAIHQGLRYARAVLADDAEAEALFLEALRDEGTLWPFWRAALQLAYGGWLRRQRRVAESRGPLRAAREIFDALGVIPWGERARRELRAAGEASRRRVTDAHERLTPQELQIAQLAAEGLSNREIGQALYLSHRTISTHLYRIFPKLGITVRTELHAALNAEHPPARRRTPRGSAL